MIESANPIIAAAPNLEAIYFSFCGNLSGGVQLPPMENLTELSLHHTSSTIGSLTTLLAVVGPRLQKFRLVRKPWELGVDSEELLPVLAPWKATLKELSYETDSLEGIFTFPGLDLLRDFGALESLCTQIGLYCLDPQFMHGSVSGMFSSTLPYSIRKLRLRGIRFILGPAMQGLLDAFRAGHYRHLRTIEILAFETCSSDEDTSDEDTPSKDNSHQSELQAIAASFKALGVDFVLEFVM